MTLAAKAALLTAILIAPAARPQKSLPPIKGITEPDEPATPQPGATSFHDTRYKLSLHIPAGWNFDRRDGSLSTFRADVRTAQPALELRGVASLNYNPYPPTTFAGANFYYSVQPRSTESACAAQATAPPLQPQIDAVIAGKPFHHGNEHHGTICTESRDEVFTITRGVACLRFDMVINTFCHASSGAMEITPSQLTDINTRMAKILDTIRLD